MIVTHRHLVGERLRRTPAVRNRKRNAEQRTPGGMIFGVGKPIARWQLRWTTKMANSCWHGRDCRNVQLSVERCAWVEDVGFSSGWQREAQHSQDDTGKCKFLSTINSGTVLLFSDLRASERIRGWPRAAVSTASLPSLIPCLEARCVTGIASKATSRKISQGPLDFT